MLGRRLVLLALIFGLAPAITDEGYSLARAAETIQRIARLGMVAPESPSINPGYVSAFLDRLRELGWIEGKNLVIVQRWGQGRYDQLAALMGEVLGQKVDVLVTWGTPGAHAAKNATSTVPIVAVMGEPVRTGLVDSLSRPGANLTGLSVGFSEGMASKWLELLQELVPRLSTVAVILNPDISVHRDIATELRSVAPGRHLKLRVMEVRGPRALDSAFEQEVGS